MEQRISEHRNSIQASEIQLADILGKSQALKDEIAQVQSQKQEISARNEESKERIVANFQRLEELHERIIEVSGNIQVYCRARPILTSELEAN